MVETEILQILEHYKIRKTDARKEILAQFLTEDSALSQPFLEKALGDGYDRVTLYRSIAHFEKKGVIHKVLDDSGIAKYALCKAGCEKNAHSDNHVHFKCATCNKTLCIEQVEIPEIKLPRGFTVETQDLLIKGICADCQ